MRRFEKTNDVVECFDFNVWKQERNIIYFKHLTADDNSNWVRMWTDLSGGYSNPIATYSLDAEHKAAIDMSDYIRAYTSMQHVFVKCQKGETIDIPLAVVGLINPASVIVPRISEADRLESLAGQNIGNTIVPPHKMLKDLGYEGTNIRCEFYPTEADVSSLDDYEWGDEVGIVNSVERSTELNLQQSTLNVYYWHERVGTWKMEALECEKRYAAVRWVSFTGATRLHTFEVRDCTREAVDVVKLETIDSSWNQIKGRQDSFKLFIDGLDAYDVWYYSDIITSSKVEVSLDGQNWQQVEVVAKSATTPNSNEGAPGKVEIQINWKKYDAVNM